MTFFYLTLCCIPEEILVGSSTFYCFHLQVKNHVMLVCQCRPLLNEVMVLVMLYLFCGSSVVFPVIVHNSLRWVNTVHGKFFSKYFIRHSSIRVRNGPGRARPGPSGSATGPGQARTCPQNPGGPARARSP